MSPHARVTLRAPGDRSVTLRALLFALAARGRTFIRRPLVSADTLAALSAVRALGATAVRRPDGALVLSSPGLAALRLPDLLVGCGESAALMRLLAGLLSAVPGRARLTGRPSLRRRPMARVIEPLSALGARIAASPGGRAPLALGGARPPRAARGAPRFRIDPPSAQVKSALLLAAAFRGAGIELEEAVATRDHTERFLVALGAPLRSLPSPGGGFLHRLSAAAAPFRPRGFSWEIPGDVSSAMLLVTAALVTPGLAPLEILGVGLNPTRTRALELLRDMGARVDWRIVRASPEPVGVLRAAYSRPGLRPVAIGAADAARAVDELPALLAVAAFAPGVSRLDGAAELRVKERDRLSAAAANLAAFGIAVEERPDGLTLSGGAPRPGRADGRGDHRTAAAGVALALGAGGRVDGVESLAKTYPRFLADLAALGASFRLARDGGSYSLLN